MQQRWKIHDKPKAEETSRSYPAGYISGASELWRQNTLLGECDNGLIYGNTIAGLVVQDSVYLVRRP